MLCKNEHGDPYFLLHFSDIHNMITNWMKFENFFWNSPFFKWNHLNTCHILVAFYTGIYVGNEIWLTKLPTDEKRDGK